LRAYQVDTDHPGRPCALGGHQFQRADHCRGAADVFPSHGIGHVDDLLDEVPRRGAQAFFELFFMGMAQQLPGELTAKQIAALACVVGVGRQVGGE